MLCSLEHRRRILVPRAHLSIHLQSDHGIVSIAAYDEVVSALGEQIDRILDSLFPEQTTIQTSAVDDIIQVIKSATTAFDRGVVDLQKQLNALREQLQALASSQSTERTLMLGMASSLVAAFVMWLTTKLSEKSSRYETPGPLGTLGPVDFQTWVTSTKSQIPLNLLEFTYELAPKLTSELIVAMEGYLRTVCAHDWNRAEVSASLINVALRRYRERGVVKIYTLGTHTSVLLAPGDTKGLQPGTIKRWVNPPRIRVNTLPNNRFSFELDEHIEYLHDGLAQFQGVIEDWHCGIDRIGQFPRNTLQEGILHVQWSNLLLNEASHMFC